MKGLRKLLIKDSESVQRPEVRLRYGIAAGIIGIISNVVLFAFKLAVGLVGASITIVADAINNLSDAGSSVVTLIGFKLSGRPADKKHPFGHARYENVTALVVALITLAIGVLLLKSSIERIISPVATLVNAYTYAVLGVAIIVKLVQMAVFQDFGKAIKSDALKASSADSRNDVLATTVVLISSIVIGTTGVNIDGYMGVAVSLFIIVSAILLVRDTVNPLIGTEPDAQLVETIRNKILSYSGVLGIHDLMIHNYGAANCFAIVHVEVDAAVPIMESHDIIDNIEHDFMRDLCIHLNIHLDPIDTADEELDLLKKRAETTLNKLNPELSFHDFRIVRGITHTNILFDVVIPYDCQLTLQDVKSALESDFEQEDKKYYFVLEMDR